MALTKAISHEGAPHNVLVNAMLVGLIESDQWRRRFDAGLLSLRVGGQPTFGLADWLTAWNVPTLFLTDREPDALPARHRDRPRIRMPLDARDLVLQVAQATGLLAPPPPAPAPKGPVGKKHLKAAKASIIEAETRITRLRLLISRYPTHQGEQLLALHEQSLTHLRKSHDLLRDCGAQSRM